MRVLTIRPAFTIIAKCDSAVPPAQLLVCDARAHVTNRDEIVRLAKQITIKINLTITRTPNEMVFAKWFGESSQIFEYATESSSRNQKRKMKRETNWGELHLGFCVVCPENARVQAKKKERRSDSRFHFRHAKAENDFNCIRVHRFSLCAKFQASNESTSRWNPSNAAIYIESISSPRSFYKTFLLWLTQHCKHDLHNSNGQMNDRRHSWFPLGKHFVRAKPEEERKKYLYVFKWVPRAIKIRQKKMLNVHSPLADHRSL